MPITDTLMEVNHHYHGSDQAPYTIGRMVGKVTEDATLQIIPQPRANPVRPSLTPLNGAVITDFVPNSSGNGYILTYERNGQSTKVDYSWTNTGKYTFSLSTIMAQRVKIITVIFLVPNFGGWFKH